MTFLSRRFCIPACALAVALAVVPAQAVVFSVKAVKINNTVLNPAQSTVNAKPGDRIVAELYVRGWNADEAGSRLSTYQYTLDGMTLFKNLPDQDNVNVVLPGCYDLGQVFKCDTLANCPAGFNACQSICRTTCDDNSQCPAGQPVCQPQLVCTGNNHSPATCNFVDTDRADFVFKNVGAPIAACNFTNGLDMACGSTLIGQGPLDTGVEKYGATFAIDLNVDNACGSIVPTFQQDVNQSYIIIEPSGSQVAVATFENLTINVVDNNMNPLPCPVTCAEITGSSPTNCAVDARAPSSVTIANPSFWFNDNFDFDLTFEGEPQGGFNQNQFSLSFVPPVAVGAPSIDGFSVNGNVVTVSVNRPPPFSNNLPRWMCINFTDPGDNCPTHTRCWGRLPGDVNGDRMVLAAPPANSDLNALIAGLNSGSLTIERCDMDRSGQCRAPDLLMWIDIANGAGVFFPFLNTTLDVCPSAP